MQRVPTVSSLITLTPQQKSAVFRLHKHFMGYHKQHRGCNHHDLRLGDTLTSLSYV